MRRKQKQAEDTKEQIAQMLELGHQIKTLAELVISTAQELKEDIPDGRA